MDLRDADLLCYFKTYGVVMNRLDLIIDALEDAVHNFAGDDTESKCVEALAAARELRALKPKANQFYPDWDMLQSYHDRIAELEAQLAQPEQEPVAWAVLRPDGRVKLLSHQQGVEVDLKWTPLYIKERT